jgi:hypothetical protein
VNSYEFVCPWRSTAEVGIRQSIITDRCRLRAQPIRISRFIRAGRGTPYGQQANPLVLFNESFAATNVREGSEIAQQIVSALLEREVMVLFVSHMCEFARSLLDRKDVLFLRADRDDERARRFRLRAAKPLPTSFGPDLCEAIFTGSTVDRAPA